MFVKPAPNPAQDGKPFRVRRPGSMIPLPDEGAEVPAAGYWLRRLRQGDVVKVDPADKQKPAEPEAQSNAAGA